jgi:hypothetical protein
MKFLDALLNRAPGNPTSTTPVREKFSSGPTVGQPVPVALVIQPQSDLTSGSDLNRAAVGAWPTLIDGGFKQQYAWRSNFLRNPYAVVKPGNYPGANSTPNWGFRFTEFFGLGSYPWSGIRPPQRPEYNALIPIQWQIQVDNENLATNTGYYNEPHGNTTKNQTSTFIPTGTASLKGSDVTLV